MTRLRKLLDKLYLIQGKKPLTFQETQPLLLADFLNILTVLQSLTVAELHTMQALEVINTAYTFLGLVPTSFESVPASSFDQFHNALDYLLFNPITNTLLDEWRDLETLLARSSTIADGVILVEEGDDIFRPSVAGFHLEDEPTLRAIVIIERKNESVYVEVVHRAGLFNSLATIRPVEHVPAEAFNWTTFSAFYLDRILQILKGE